MKTRWVVRAGRGYKFMPRQKNSWAVFGAGKAQSALYKAVSKKRIDLFFRDPF
jgi:hypothetical protein